MANEEINCVFDGFKFDFANPKVLRYLFINSIIHHSTILALKELLTEKLCEITGKSLDEIQNLFLEIHDKYQKDTIADILTSFGIVDDTQPPTIK